MKKFHFPLETLLELRIRREEALQEQLGKKRGEITSAQTELNDLSEQLRGMQSEQRCAVSEKRSNILSLRTTVSWRNSMKQEMLSKGKFIQEMEADAEYIRRRLVKASQARKVLETLKEKRHLEWKVERNRVEQAFIDEVSTQRFIRDKNRK